MAQRALPHVRSRCADSMCVCSGSAALDESWVQADVSDVMSVQQPGEETLQTQTVTTVRACAVFPLVSIPVVRG